MYTAAELALLRAANPKLKLAGIDTTTENLIPLADLIQSNLISTSTSSGLFYDKKNNRVVVSKDNAVVSGYDFKGVTLYITGKNVTVQNCNFEAGANQYYCVQAQGTGATVKNCTFTGGSATNALPLADFIMGSGMTIQGDRFLNAPGDGLHITSGSITNCYFSGGGYSSVGLHPDAIWVSNTDGPLTISGNFVDYTVAGSTFSTGMTNSALRITTELGSTSDVTVTNNVFLGGTYTVYPGSPTGSMSNVVISNNVIGLGLYGAFYTTNRPGVTITNNTVFDLTNPAYSTTAWNAYVAKGVGTAALVASTAGGDVTAPTSGSSTLYGAGANVHMYGSASAETVFVGGAGGQYEVGGKGAGIYKYLAFSDSTTMSSDLIWGFDTAKDVIDLSAIVTDPAGGSQGFTFIGGSAFTSAGEQLRVTQDVAANMTYVDATMAGDATADLHIRINGLVNLTADNFALTAAQSAADLANGAALKVTRTTGAGNATLYAYTNVLGHSYGSFEEIFNPAGTMVAEAFNLNSGAGTVDLMGSGLTYSDGATGESLKTGAATFSLGSHSSQSLQLDGANEQLQFHTGFGAASVSGFGVGDTLQFDKSMFSYVAKSMTQAQDLAAVLSHASSSGSDLILWDSAGDKLTLTGVTAAQLTAHANSVSFV